MWCRFETDAFWFDWFVVSVVGLLTLLVLVLAQMYVVWIWVRGFSVCFDWVLVAGA